ncbi:unnamed protein product [Mytilus coruscus]|uniref:Uncharacterized protein n=1 Tax=Mytilus coruscus TaxID=42192 RepID=A0A6J8DPZ7_MYTCO|nr:unnamed protein product [Mytilus coruscus]
MDVIPNICKEQPLTGLGRLLHNRDDSRRRPVHKQTDISQITFITLILKLKYKYSISEEDLLELLLLFQKIAPTDNILPQTTFDIDRLTKDLIVGHESSSWNAFVTEMGSKAIALSYCSDGFNPFHHIITQGTYSIWAQTGLILNLPAHMRVKTGTTLLLGLIFGPRAPKRLNLYNEILVNELVKLKDGLQVYNAASKQLEMTRVGLLYMVSDVPGIAKENRVQQNALNSCSHCIMQDIESGPALFPDFNSFIQFFTSDIENGLS